MQQSEDKKPRLISASTPFVMKNGSKMRDHTVLSIPVSVSMIFTVTVLGLT
jgi:hypothetical protein